MSELRTALHLAAGPPAAGPDLTAVQSRIAQRRRRRTALTATAVVLPLMALGTAVGLAAGGDRGPVDVLVPATAPPSPGPTPVLSGPTPAPAAPSPAPPSVRSTVPPVAAPSTAVPPSPAVAVPDGVVLGLVTATDGRTVTWDQVDQRPGQCGESPEAAPTYASFHARCYRNTNPRLRTAPVSPGAPVRVRPGNGPGRSVAPSALPYETSAGAANDIPAQYRVWELTIVGGTVVAMEQGDGGGA